MSVLVKLGLLALLWLDTLGQTSAVGGTAHVFEMCLNVCSFREEWEPGQQNLTLHNTSAGECLESLLKH